MKKNKTLMASALVFSGLAALAGSGWAHASESITTIEGLTTCLTTNNSTCVLGGDIAVNETVTIDIPQNTKTSLDLNGHKLYENENKELFINNLGDLTILNSGTTIGSCDAGITVKDNGKLEISNGTFNDSVREDSNTDHTGNTSIKISGGVFNGSVNALDNGSLLDILGGTFNSTVSLDGKTANISDGTFNDDVYFNKGTANILNGVFNGDVRCSGNDEINGGVFKGTLFVNDPGSSLVINGGTFNDINAIEYIEGSSLKITDGKFTKGFSIGLENVSITGGTFHNGTTESEGWMSLILDHPDVQKYSITGGTFLNTGDDGGVLMAIKTITQPTLDNIQSLFAGGTVLDGTVIELADTEPYYSYIKKQKTDADGDIAVPDTGSVTKSGDELKAIGGIIAGAVMLFTAGSFMVFKSRKELFRKKVGFNKK